MNIKEVEQKRYKERTGWMQRNRIVYTETTSDNETTTKKHLEINISTLVDELNKLKSEVEKLKTTINSTTEEPVFKEISDAVLIDGEGSELVVYDAKASDFQSGDVYYEEKRGLLGGTKMVKKTVK